ncbi:MAG: CPXCG motif-containing cysteine-rich protein [Pseudomonadota bacterium]
MVEHRFECPYCWESITMLLDLTANRQEYVEDCEVCCNPIAIAMVAESGLLVEFDAVQMD